MPNHPGQMIKTEPMLRVVGQGVVYRNPKPQIASIQAFFPSVVVVDPQHWIISMDVGSAFEAGDVRSMVAHTKDGGQTWSNPAPIVAESEIPDKTSMTCRISKLIDGTLIGLICYFNRTRSEYGLTNPETEGFVETDFFIIRSRDHGMSWSKPNSIQLPLKWSHLETCSPIIEIEKDRYVIPTSTWPNWEGECPGGMRALGFVSNDAGETWSEVVQVMDLFAQGITSWEQKITTLSSGQVLAVAWAYDFQQRLSLNNTYALSNDGCRSFGPVQQTGLSGETCTPIALEDNHVLCVYRRTDLPGLWAHLGQIENGQWVGKEDLSLWSGGHLYGEDSESVMHKLGTLRFGCPSIGAISANEFVVAFWCIEDCVSAIRWFRLKVAL